MVGNIMELNNPTARIDHIEINPCVLIDINIIRIANEAKILKTFPASIIFVR